EAAHFAAVDRDLSLYRGAGAGRTSRLARDRVCSTAACQSHRAGVHAEGRRRGRDSRIAGTPRYTDQVFVRARTGILVADFGDDAIAFIPDRASDHLAGAPRPHYRKMVTIAYRRG